MRKVPASSINLFQLIYKIKDEYEASSGQKAMNLSLGNPDLIPPDWIIDLKSKEASKKDFELHTYAEDRDYREFSIHLVKAMTGVDLKIYPHLGSAPIAGIKTASALVPLACGLQLSRQDFVCVTESPAYDILGQWTQNYFGAKRLYWMIQNKSSQRHPFDLDELKNLLAKSQTKSPDLIFTIRPGNPVAKGMNSDLWKELIEYCIQNKIRLVNDGAYTSLASPEVHISLSQVAKDYPELEWAELFSVSKSLSDPGARLGVWVGSKDFLQDFLLIKGNTDSGPSSVMLSAYAQVFSDTAKAIDQMAQIRNLYQERVHFLFESFVQAGFRPVCPTEAGFFMLFYAPTSAFGQEISLEGQNQSLAEAFNRKVVSKTGLVGVHFAPNLIRYAACFDVFEPHFKERFCTALRQIKPQYSPIHK